MKEIPDRHLPVCVRMCVRVYLCAREVLGSLWNLHCAVYRVESTVQTDR
ncbi:unnamed protein product, partial [Heterotrigona itama]